MDITQFGKGAIPTPEDIKKDHYRLSAIEVPAIDWNKPRRERYMPIRTQDGSSSCTSYGSAYYGQHLNKLRNGKLENYSRRHIYSQIHLGGGGAYIYAALRIPLLQGYVSEDSVPGENAPESVMIDSSMNKNAIVEAMPLKYAMLSNTRNMDYLAYIIDTYGGFVTGFSGGGNMFDADGTVRIPTSVEWGHCVYAYDYETHKNEKAITFINSWTDGWGDKGYGYFPETFVKGGPMFDLYTFASIEDIDPLSMQNRFVKLEGSNDIYVVKDGTRSLIYNALAFNLMNGDWNKIETLTQDQFLALQDTGKVLIGADQE